jgi:RNA polymerase sigma-70 factor (ECF subfamily)
LDRQDASPRAPVEPDPGIASFLARIQAGDEDAARELLTRYEAEVRLVVRRQLPRLLRSRFDSLDFLQSVWGDFFKRVRDGAAGFEDERHLVGFLARAAKNKVIDQYRRAGSQKQDMHREETIWTEAGRPRDLAAPDDTPSLVAEANEAYDRLRALLPEDRRQILALKAEGRSSREIGDALGMSERTVQRVIEDLRRRVGVGVETGELAEG